MATATLLRRMALALPGTTEYPHFDRAAFKVAVTYVTLATDGCSANFKFSPDEQALKCEILPDGFTAIPNAWGRRGWTTAHLAKLTDADLADALKLAWSHAGPRKRTPAGRK